MPKNLYIMPKEISPLISSNLFTKTLLHHWQRRSNYTTGLIFIDLKKAFDTVDHEILLKKPWTFMDWLAQGMIGPYHTWIIKNNSAGLMALPLMWREEIVEFLKALTLVHSYSWFKSMICFFPCRNLISECMPMIRHFPLFKKHWWPTKLPKRRSVEVPGLAACK